MGEIVTGTIVRHDESGILISAQCKNLEQAAVRRYEKVLVEFTDGRLISPEQRRKSHALIGEIADWMGDVPEYVKRLMKLEFMADRLNSLEKKVFSHADCDMTTAREFISYLIDFMLRFDVPCKVPLYDLCDDIERYVYACLMHKKCAICGGKGEMHHYDALGMGSDRTTVYQIGYRVISLCRAHHTEAHTKGGAWIADDMHLVPVPLTVEIGKVYKLSKKALGVGS